MSRLDALRNELSNLDSDIQCSKERLRSLENRRDEIQQYLDTITYPILSIPREITSQIFLHSFSSNAEDEPRFAQAPLLFLLVCKDWRQIALDTHGLWTRLQLFTEDLPFDYIVQAQRLPKMVHKWFQRAGTLPLSLDLTAWDTVDGEDFRSIVSHNATQLQSLTLSLPLEDFPVDTIDFPMLERVTLSVLLERTSIDEYLSSGNQPYRCFSGAPRLREVCLYKPANPKLFILPSARLTKFTGEGLTADECLDLLRSAPSLIECRLTVEIDDPPLDRRRVVLHHLQLLQLARSPYSAEVEHAGVADILELLDAPVLERLELNYIPDLDLFDEQMTTFFSRVSASLRHFSFSGDDCEAFLPVTALQWFCQLLQLTHVEFVRPEECFINVFIAALMEDGFLPRLHTLRFLDYSFRADEALMEALSSRSVVSPCGHERAPLKVFDLLWAHPVHAHSLEKEAAMLDMFAKHGMQVHIGIAESSDGDDSSFTLCLS